MTTTQSYNAISRSLHWLIALLIFWAIVLGLVAEELPNSPEKIELFVLHKSAGFTVLVLAILRLFWRLKSPPPPLGLSQKQESMAKLGHWGLYALMISVPLSGWLLNSTAGYPFAWFNLISIPHVPGLDKEARGLFASIHVALFYVIAAMIIGHVLMLFHHKFADGLNLLPRMLPGKTAVTAMALVAVLAALVGYTINKAYNIDTPTENQSADAVESASAAETDNPATAGGQSTSPLWQLIPAKDNFRFHNSYAGEAFTGSIPSFQPAIYFDPENPEEGLLDVTIDTTSITTNNKDWDATLKSSQWFATSQYNTAHYLSEGIRVTPDGFVADGNLTLKGITKPIAVTFVWQEQNEEAMFIGTATIDRRDFEVGSGSWATDDSVAFEVKLDINLELERASP